MLCRLRWEAHYWEEEIAEKLRFGSAEAMHIQLKNWDLPEWLIHGGSERTKEQAELERVREQERAESRPPRSPKEWGDALKLPPAENAIGLFKDTLKLLIEKLEDLRGREEYLQSGRFVGARRQGGKREALGARQFPPEPLTTLIGVYALFEQTAQGPGMWWLLGKLHWSEQREVREKTSLGTFVYRQPDPNKVDMKKLEARMEALRKAARQVAQIVRGKELSSGAPASELSPRHYAVLEAVTTWSRDGDSDEEIAREINSRYGFGLLEAEFTAEEVRGIRERGATPPK